MKVIRVQNWSQIEQTYETVWTILQYYEKGNSADTIEKWVWKNRW